MRFGLTVLGVLSAAGLTVPAIGFAQAERLENPIAVFSGLDKITAVITSFEVGIGETRRFGQLDVTPHVCYSRPPTETPKTTSFITVDEVDFDGSRARIFAGWMFAESPGLNAVEHPVYDVWLTACRDPDRRDELLPDDADELERRDALPPAGQADEIFED